MRKSLRREFDSVDRSSNPNNFVHYLDVTRNLSFFQRIKNDSFAAMEVCHGDVVADVGCGTGEDVLHLGTKAGPDGRALGIDISSTMIASAQERSGSVATNVNFIQGDVHNLCFRDDTFDAVRAERLLQHTSDPVLALREMTRVLKAGGRIVNWEADLDLFVIDAADYESSRIMQRFISQSFRHGCIGHEVYRLFIEFGLTDVRTTPLIGHFSDLALIESAFDLTTCVRHAVEQGVLASARGTRWLDSLRQANQSSRFSSAVGGFLTSGRKLQGDALTRFETCAIR